MEKGTHYCSCCLCRPGERKQSLAPEGDTKWMMFRMMFMFLEQRSSQGKTLALGLVWALWSTLVVVGHKLHLRIFQFKAPTVLETGLGWNLRRWCFYSSCQGCVYTLRCGLSVWGHSRAQGLWGLCQRSWIFGTISICALAWGWILVHTVSSVVTSLLFGGKYLCHFRRNQSAGIQIKGSKPRKEAGRYPSWQCKSTTKIVDWRNSAGGPGGKFPLNHDLIRKVHTKNILFLMEMCLDGNASLHVTGLKRNFTFLSSNYVVCLAGFGDVWARMVAAMWTILK